jgi:hypothetical protein
MTTAAVFPEGHSRSITGIGRSGVELTISVGNRVRFRRPDGYVAIDVVRTCFHAYVLVAPYAPNYSEPAVVLTEHSWTRVSDVIEVLS